MSVPLLELGLVRMGFLNPSSILSLFLLLSSIFILNYLTFPLSLSTSSQSLPKVKLKLVALVFLGLFFFLLVCVFLKAGVVAGTFLKVDLAAGVFFDGVDFGFIGVFLIVFLDGVLGDFGVCGSLGVFLPVGWMDDGVESSWCLG